MIKKTVAKRKIRLNRETVRQLDETLLHVAGGAETNTCTSNMSCVRTCICTLSATCTATTCTLTDGSVGSLCA